MLFFQKIKEKKGEFLYKIAENTSFINVLKKERKFYKRIAKILISPKHRKKPADFKKESWKKKTQFSSVDREKNSKFTKEWRSYGQLR